ncbi:ROK family protein, partial [Escherichia coli]|nr:ROK family protein [Escherichia coli]
MALAAIDDFATWLGRGLSMVGDVFDPELIVIGGGVASASDLYLDKAKAEFARNLTGAGYRPVA